MSFMNLANRESGRQHAGRVMTGEVDSWDPSTHSAKVRIPTEVDGDGNPRISGWSPKLEPSGGANGSDATGLSPGDLVVVAYLENDPEVPVVLGALHNDKDRPPGVQSGERRIAAFGAVISIDKDGRLTMSGAGGSSTVHNPDGSIVHTDAAGGVIRQAGGKVYLVSATATDPVMLQSGPSSKIFGVL